MKLITDADGYVTTTLSLLPSNGNERRGIHLEPSFSRPLAETAPKAPARRLLPPTQPSAGVSFARLCQPDLRDPISRGPLPPHRAGEAHRGRAQGRQEQDVGHQAAPRPLPGLRRHGSHAPVRRASRLVDRLLHRLLTTAPAHDEPPQSPRRPRLS